MSRILSQHGNVIAADFRRRTGLSIEIEFETLYQDDRVLLSRATFSSGLPPAHFFADLLTGEIKTL